MACTNGNATCIPIGPTGATGATGATGPAGPTGPQASFANSYVGVTSGISLSNADGNWGGDDTYYTPTGYTTLTYTNSLGTTEDFIIRVNFNSGTSDLNNYGQSDVTCGIFLNTDLVTPLWSTNNYIAYADPSVQTVYAVKQNADLFYKVTLANGAGITVQFKTKGTGEGYLNNAQMFVQQL